MRLEPVACLRLAEIPAQLLVLLPAEPVQQAVLQKRPVLLPAGPVQQVVPQERPVLLLAGPVQQAVPQEVPVHRRVAVPEQEVMEVDPRSC